MTQYLKRFLNKLCHERQIITESTLTQLGEMVVNLCKANTHGDSPFVSGQRVGEGINSRTITFHSALNQCLHHSLVGEFLPYQYDCIRQTLQ